MRGNEFALWEVMLAAIMPGTIVIPAFPRSGDRIAHERRPARPPRALQRAPRRRGERAGGQVRGARGRVHTPRSR